MRTFNLFLFLMKKSDNEKNGVKMQRNDINVSLVSLIFVQSLASFVSILALNLEYDV